MNENEFDLAARAWLDDGPTRMSDRAVLSALEEIHTTRQRRAMWPAWRATPVSFFARVATAAILVVAVGLLAFTVVPRQPTGPSVGGPLAGDFPELTTTFVSPRHGYSIKHPDGASITPATDILEGSHIDVIETGLAAVFHGMSTEADVPAAGEWVDTDGDGLADAEGPPVDEWVDGLVIPDLDAPGCRSRRSEQAEITIDGLPGRISESCPNEIQATVIAERTRLYVFTLLHDRTDARAVFDTFAATIDLTPETAVDVPSMAARPTFVSPTYGFSWKYIDRGGLKPATELWDPGDQHIDVNFDPAFDAVETGYGAYFEAASTAIPDGVSIETWLDAAAAKYLPGSCAVPRSQQAEITIDGQPGRVTEDCPDRIVASVVVDGRLYVFRLWSTRTDARAFFDAVAATIDLRPEDAANPSGTPSP